MNRLMTLAQVMRCSLFYIHRDGVSHEENHKVK